MQLGLVSAILPDDSLDSVCATAGELGYDCVELMCWPVGKASRRYAGVTHVDVANFDEAAAADVRAVAERHGISISGLGYYPNPLAPDQAEADQAIEQIRKVIAASAQLGVNQMNTFVGRDWTKSIDGNWPRFLETWIPLVKFAEQHGVRIGIENCPMLFTNDEWPGGKNLAVSPAVWRRMFDAIPSPNFGLNYDPSHLVWQQMDYVAPLRDFADRLFHIHAKDVRINKDRLDDVGILASPLEYHTPKLPGLGDIDWGRFISVLGDTGYRGSVCVEVEDKAYEESATTRRMSLQQSCTYLRNFLPLRESRSLRKP
ncbi:MAG: sugar phosphate isomerase/epimerase [Planctomycetota bacterium]|nr:sugar phosphate isomerase/epimerase [Planctomycetota bacterium]